MYFDHLIYFTISVQIKIGKLQKFLKFKNGFDERIRIDYNE